MKQIVFRIVFFALIAHMCKAAIVIPTRNRERINFVYNAAIDVLTKCNLGGGNTVGIVGDSDGFITKLWTKHHIPAVLVNSRTNVINVRQSNVNCHRLQAFVIIADTPELFHILLKNLAITRWWNHNAKFLILSPTPDKFVSPSDIVEMQLLAYLDGGILDAQFIQSYTSTKVVIFDFNPFMSSAPKPWKLLGCYKSEYMPIYMFAQIYRKGEKTCEALNFKKTSDIGGQPFEFAIGSDLIFCQLTRICHPLLDTSNGVKEIDELVNNRHRWFIDTIATALNASVVLKRWLPGDINFDISLMPGLYADLKENFLSADAVIHTYSEWPLFGMTQHTAHMSQIEKILSVIDKTSQMGMYLVYLITFLFFKFFLRQAAIPAILNLVRLTCGTGLPKLPTNVAPTIYLACVFMFVVTMQGIYTGNLAALLTTTVAYPHVNTKEDVPKLGYTVYAYNIVYNKIAADPILDGRVIKIPPDVACKSYVLSDPLALCVSEYYDLVTLATLLNLHISSNPLQYDYYYYMLSPGNPLGRRIQDIIIRFHECGLRRFDEAFYKLHLELVDDGEVKKNMVRRVMNLDDLRFAFVILGIGIICSIICFIAEILISYMSSRFAKSRNRVRPILALAGTKKKSSWYTALKLRFNGLRLFRRRR